ncbi:MAG: MarC family protein [Nitrososphaerota archaeon]|nr:MarC family protein [Candidatus Calditenuis fumarioli]
MAAPQGTELVWELVRATVALFIIVDPVGTVPFFELLTSGMDRERRSTIVRRAVLVGTALLLLFAAAGNLLLELFGISLQSFLVGGGMLLVLLAIRIILHGGEGWGSGHSTGVFPLAFPLLVGPGAITTTMISIRSLGIPLMVIPVAVVMALTWAVLEHSELFTRFLGKDGADAVARVMAVFMTAIGVEYVVRGARELIYG